MSRGQGRLLLYASIGDREEGILARCREIVRRSVDWQGLLTDATACGEAGNLADLLACAGIDTPCSGELRAAAKHELRRTMVMRECARDAIAMLSKERIAFIPLKGADPRIDSLRGVYNPMTDIDILMPEAACDHAAGLLLGNGWRFLGKTSGSHMTFHHGTSDCLLEMHWDVVNRANPVHTAVFSPNLETVLARSAETNGLRVLSPADTAAYLTAHAVKEYFHKPKWLADIARFIHNVPFDAHTRGVFEEWGAVPAFGIVTAVLGHLYNDVNKRYPVLSLFSKPGIHARMAAEKIADGGGLRRYRPLFWLAGAGSAKKKIHLGIGMMRRMLLTN